MSAPDPLRTLERQGFGVGCHDLLGKADTPENWRDRYGARTPSDENVFDGKAPAAGERLTVTCRGRTFEAQVIVGRFPGRPELPVGEVYPIRVEEI